jgi:tetratricopeptide (TPR) repeat protein
LVIGSQCPALGDKNHLAFLPTVAQELAAVLTNPEAGGCVPAVNGDPLLLNPTSARLDTAIEQAIANASQNEATLLVAFVGHGEHAKDDFYLLPYDLPHNRAMRPNSKVAFQLAHRIKEMLGAYSQLDGLVLLVDTCHAGLGARQAAARWPDIIAEAGGRFEMLTATNDRLAYDGCFTATLAQLLENGEVSLGENLRSFDLKRLIQAACDKQVATYLAFDGSDYTLLGDEGLWLARNRARRRSAATPLAGTAAWAQVERLTQWFERTPQLDRLVEASRSIRSVAVVGPSGQGKSTLAAAMVRAELAPDLSLSRFVHGLLFAVPASSPEGLARALADQLTLTVDGFSDATARFHEQTPEELWVRLDPWERQILGPLRLVELDPPVRIVLDGLDQFPEQTATSIRDALSTLASEPTLGHVRLVLTVRSDFHLPSGTHQLTLDRIDDRYVERYLRRRGVPDPAILAVRARAAGNWLIARLLADVAVEGELSTKRLPSTLESTYRQELQRAVQDDPETWTRQLRPVLAVLAVADVGPILPLPFLCSASGRMGGPDRIARVRDVLVRLRGLVVRGNPGTPHEQVGLFHATLADYLVRDAQLGIDSAIAHIALADAVAQLAPMHAHDFSDPLHRYAMVADAEHLWHAGRFEQALASLRARKSHVPADNLARWTAWFPRVRKMFGSDHSTTLAVRTQIAHYTGQIGDPHEALHLYRGLLADSERIRGPDHPDTLATRHEVARYTGEAGDPLEALRLYREILADSERILGPDHPHILNARNVLAYFTGKTGDPVEALRLYREVLADSERVLGPDDPDTLSTRRQLAYYTGQTRDPVEALALYREVLTVMEHVLGRDHPDTLSTRHDTAYYTNQTGDPVEALALYREVLADRERILGPNHPDTLGTRHEVARLTGRTGDPVEALRLYNGILAVKERVLGRDHPDTLTTGHQVAYWTGETGDHLEALRLFRAVLADKERILGTNHRSTLITRHEVEYFTNRVSALVQAPEAGPA